MTSHTPTQSAVSHKVHENHLRLVAKRQDLLLVKSPRRDPLASDFERYVVVPDTAYNRKGRWASSDAERERAQGRMRDLDSMDAFLKYPLDDSDEAELEAWNIRLHMGTTAPSSFASLL